MTPLDAAFPQQLQMPPHEQGLPNYAVKPQQPGVQFGHMPHTDMMLRGAAGDDRQQQMQQQMQNMHNSRLMGDMPAAGATSLGGGPNVEHNEKHAPQYDYSMHPQHPQFTGPQQHQQPPPQFQHQQPPPQFQHQQPPPQFQHQQPHPPHSPQRMQQPMGPPRPLHNQHQLQQHQQHQRLAQQTGPAPVAAEVITKTKSGMSTNKILLVVLVSVIFLGLGIGIIIICKKSKNKKLGLKDGAPVEAVFPPSVF